MFLIVSVTQFLRNVRLAGNRIFLAFASLLQNAIASLMARSSASDSVGAAADVDTNAAPLTRMAATILAHKSLVKRDMICSLEHFGATNTMCSIAASNASDAL
ncbi:MAG: hypothetical protein WB499_13445 [Pseudolabrys sp.]